MLWWGYLMDPKIRRIVMRSRVDFNSINSKPLMTSIDMKVIYLFILTEKVKHCTWKGIWCQNWTDNEYILSYIFWNYIRVVLRAWSKIILFELFWIFLRIKYTTSRNVFADNMIYHIVYYEELLFPYLYYLSTLKIK